jgi:hypothetical protein
MKNYIAAISAIGASLLASACASSGQPPAAQAANVERVQCDGSATTQGEVELLRSVTVLDMEPIYSHVPTANNNTEDRVNGAKLLIRPPKGMDAEEMTRVLQCHSARVLLGQVSGSAVSNDPYWLPDAWVHIEVEPEDGNFAVLLSTDSIHDSLEVLGRAHQYAGEHLLAVAPPLP